MRIDSIVDVAEQIQLDRKRLSPKQRAAYDKCMVKVRAVINESPDMCIGVIFEIAGQMLCDVEGCQSSQ